MESRVGPWLARLVSLWLLLIGRFLDCRVIHDVLKFFAGLEIGNLFGGHFHARPGLGITADARLPLPCAKASESADLDFVASPQRLHDTVEDGLDDDLGFLAGHLDHSRDLFNKIRLGHVHASLKAQKLKKLCSLNRLQTCNSIACWGGLLQSPLFPT